ncbi:MAG: energy transducer TonB [Thermoproteota archaeon]|nr:energy transducer TonB [Thermoproteota archaeon]
MIRISSADFYGEAKSKPLPPYPVIARAAHVEGTVIVEILIDEAGGVSCARALSGHPLLRAAAVAAAKKWSFSASEISREQTQSIGNIAFHFRYVKIVPERDGNIAESK